MSYKLSHTRLKKHILRDSITNRISNDSDIWAFRSSNVEHSFLNNSLISEVSCIFKNDWVAYPNIGWSISAVDVEEKEVSAVILNSGLYHITVC